MQADVHQAKYKDVVFVNGIVNVARKTRDVGIDNLRVSCAVVTS